MTTARKRRFAFKMSFELTELKDGVRSYADVVIARSLVEGTVPADWNPLDSLKSAFNSGMRNEFDGVDLSDPSDRVAQIDSKIDELSGALQAAVAARNLVASDINAAPRNVSVVDSNLPNSTDRIVSPA